MVPSSVFHQSSMLHHFCNELRLDDEHQLVISEIQPNGPENNENYTHTEHIPSTVP